MNISSLGKSVIHIFIVNIINYDNVAENSLINCYVVSYNFFEIILFSLKTRIYNMYPPPRDLFAKDKHATPQRRQMDRGIPGEALW